MLLERSLTRYVGPDIMLIMLLWLNADASPGQLSTVGHDAGSKTCRDTIAHYTLGDRRAHPPVLSGPLKNIVVSSSI